MISVTLPPVDRRDRCSLEEVAEALALTYWAYYNNAPVEPRVWTAMQRAWGLDTHKLFARDGVNVGFITTTATLPHRKTFNVGIEGTTNLSQVGEYINAELTRGLPPGVLRSVYKYFLDKADVVWDRLHADATSLAAINSGLYMFTFSGHSLGAAVADLLAFKWKQTYPAKPVRVIKFGCPRIGNTFYVNRTEYPVLTASFYAHEDPIHQFPSSTICPVNLLNLVGAVTRLNPCSDDTVSIIPRVPRNGAAGAYGGIYGYTLSNAQSCGHFLDAIALSRTIDPDNVWYWHLMKSYRLCMMNLVKGRDDMLKYRFNYLEFNDENAWQVRHGPGTLQWNTMDTAPLLPVQPDPQEPISGPIVERITRPAPAPQNPTVPLAAAANEEHEVERQIVPVLAPPLVTSVQPRRRFQRVAPN